MMIPPPPHLRKRGPKKNTTVAVVDEHKYSTPRSLAIFSNFFGRGDGVL